jgi:hypothetical protein
MGIIGLNVYIEPIFNRRIVEFSHRDFWVSYAEVCLLITRLICIVLLK